MKTLTTTIALLATLLSAEISHAESTGYEVEVIIFSYLNNRYSASENWPEISVQKEPEVTELQEESAENNSTAEEVISEENNSAETVTATDKLVTTEELIAAPIDLTKEAEYLSTEHYRLTKQAERIQKNKNYNLLIHKAWKQAGLPSEQAFSIQLNSLEAAAKTSEPPAQETEIVAIPTPAVDQEITETSSVPTEYLEGNIKLVMSRYLHISADLILHKFTEKQNEDGLRLGSEEQLFNINIERRMKSREIHFIDHPLLGILVIATPFIISDVDEEDTHPESGVHYKTL